MADQVISLNGITYSIVSDSVANKISASEKVKLNKNPQPTKQRVEGSSVKPDNFKEVLESSINELNNYFKESTLEFKLDNSTGISYVKLVDSKTKEIIRQIPSEEMIAMAKKLKKLFSKPIGIFLDKKG